VLAEIGCDRVDYSLWDLGAAGAVEEDSGVAVYGLRQRRELRANVGEVEGDGSELFGGRHGNRLIVTWGCLVVRIPG
jgi:hypothetical protein